MSWGTVLFIFEMLGLGGNYLIGQKNKLGWAILVFHNIPWFIYAIATHQYTFVLLPITWVAMHAYNWRKWHKEDQWQSQLTTTEIS